jgi:hypothetical protein
LPERRGERRRFHSYDHRTSRLLEASFGSASRLTRTFMAQRNMVASPLCVNNPIEGDPFRRAEIARGARLWSSGAGDAGN